MPRLTFIDTETTGLPPDGKVCEIGACSPFSDPMDIQDLVDPGVPISPEASAIHHITDDDVVGKPSIGEVWSEYDSITDVFVAHNAEFDKAMLPETDKPWICTKKLAAYFFEDAPSYKIQVLRYWLRLEVFTPPNLYAHRALYDAIVCSELYLYMRDAFGFSDEQAIEISQQPMMIRSMPFGKYKGQPLSNVAADSGYIDWLYKQDNISPDLIYWLDKELEK